MSAAIGKGFAIGSAALVSLALFGAFITRCSTNMPADVSLVTQGVGGCVCVGGIYIYIEREREREGER